MDPVKNVSIDQYQSGYNKPLNTTKADVNGSKTTKKAEDPSKRAVHESQIMNEMKIALNKEGLGNYIDLLA